VEHQIVQVHEAFVADGAIVPPGARLVALKKKSGAWAISFNGLDVEVPDGVVAPLGVTPAPRAGGPVYSDARMEQYQLAPAAKPA
jgi:hypothetical protein